MPSWEDIPIESDLAFEEAHKLDLEVRVADDFTLQLDLDSDEAYLQWRKYEGRMRAHYGMESFEETLSRNGNRHVYIKLQNALKAPERIALQACLGSDPTREFLSLKRWLNNDPNPILLFETKQKLLVAAEGI
jgi:hypothetical protein